jgi:hypothetical protein
MPGGQSRVLDGEPYLLTGVLYCGSCGYRMRAGRGDYKQDNGRRYYKCKGRHRIGRCPAPVNVPAEDVEAFMVATFVEHVHARTYGGSANSETVVEAERTYDRQVEIVRAMAPEYMSRHVLADDVREIVEATWTRANAELDRLREAQTQARSEAVGVVDWPEDVSASNVAALPTDELKTLIAATFPVVFVRRGVGFREPVAERLRPLWRSQAPAEIVAGKRMRPIRSYFVAA